MYPNPLNNSKDSFYHSLSNAGIHSMLWMIIIQVQQLVIYLNLWIEAEQYCQNIFYNRLILSGLTFYLIMKFYRLTYSWSTGKLWVLSAAHLWIQYLINWRLYLQNFQVKSLTCTMTLMITKRLEWIFCVLTFAK